MNKPLLRPTHYAIRHTTVFRYSAPVHESVMELRMQPRSEGPQSLRSFQIATSPRAQLYAYADHLGNAVYHFNVLREHDELKIDMQAQVEMNPMPPLPEAADELEWERYNSLNLTADHYDFLEASKLAHPSAVLEAFVAKLGLGRPAGDPLTAMRALNARLYEALDYEIGITEVHSTLDHAIREGRGVCQDFAHIMIAIARSWGIPARYVSGYLFHRREDQDRSGEDASHAWMEAYFPSMGWVGFDPTNNILAEGRHIRVAVGRDYADVPPTRGTFKGDSASELSIAVSVQTASAPARHEEFLRIARQMKPAHPAPARADLASQQQQQQQQQQQ